MISTKAEEELRLLRVALLESLTLSEAPSARAAQDVRVHGSKTETIDPKGTGESVEDKIVDIITHAREKAQLAVNKARFQKPGSWGNDYQGWACYVYDRYGEGRATIREAAGIERCDPKAISKALAVGARLSQRKAA